MCSGGGVLPDRLVSAGTCWCRHQVLEKALVIAKEKSLKKCIPYLIVSDYIKNTGHDIAAFLRVYAPCDR